jgi:DNA-binding MarR family transcriptional regulator
LYGPSTPRDPARGACVTTGGMTVALDRLETDGYVKRQANPADRRSCTVHLIPRSLRKLEAVYRSKGEQLSAAMERYTDANLRLLIEFFEQINGGVSPPAASPSPAASSDRSR